MDNKAIFELADELKALQDEKKSYDEKAKELSSKIEEVDARLTELMTTEEVDKFTHSGSTFYLKSRCCASAIAGHKDDMIKALKENGYGSLVVEQVNANTLSSFIKEQRELNGNEIPEFLKDSVQVFDKVNVGIRKS